MGFWIGFILGFVSMAVIAMVWAFYAMGEGE